MSRIALSSLALVFASLAVACGSSPTTGAGTPGTGDGSGEPSTAPAAPGSVKETGTIVDFSTKKPIAGATITAGSQTVKTAADGSFSVSVVKGAAFAFTVTADGYATLLEQETSLDADYASGPTTLVPTSTASLLTQMLDGYDATLGVLAVQLMPTGSCASEDGATIAITPAGSAKIAYFQGSLPAPSLAAVKAGSTPSAVVYNVQPGVPVSVTVTEASCKQTPFPVTQGAISYTGSITTQAGETTAFARVFLQ